MITGLEICYKLLSACKPFILKSLKPFEKLNEKGEITKMEVFDGNKKHELW